ncbi:ATP-binding protein [soil metagenome]
MKCWHSLRARLVLWTVTLEALLLLILAVVLVIVLQDLQNRQLNATLRLSADQLNAVIDLNGDQFILDPADIVALRSQGVLAWVLTPEGKTVKTVGEAATLPVPTALPSFDQFTDLTLSNGMLVRLIVMPFQEEGQTLGVLVLALPLHPNQVLIRQILISLGIAIPVVLLLSTVGGLFLAGRALGPVTTITATARRISAIDLNQRLRLDLPDDEIGQLAHTFNAMLDRLEQAFERERQLTADVSHELRTPLAMIKTQLSLARSRPRDQKTLLAMLADMEGDVDRMTRLIEQMLTLAWVEQHQLPVLPAVSLAGLLTELVAQLNGLAEQRAVQLTLHLPAQTSLSVEGDAECLRQVFANLIENAIRYTQANGQVTVQATCRNHRVTVVVADTGIGIPLEHLTDLFERFYRVDRARTRDTGGFGLGLAIAQAITQMHHGQIDVRSTLSQGTTFTVTLPIQQLHSKA